ncbi:hypothetical protein U1Q18_051865 [Sarracenia purpurea var. burkii]
MFFYMKRLLLAVFAFNYQTLPPINGNPANMSDPSSAKIADTESKGFSSWVPQWCRNGYNGLFGDDGIITRIVPSFFGRSKQEPIQCCCRPVANDDQPTPEKNVREIYEQEEKKVKDNKCVKAVGNGLKNTGMCFGAVGYVCGWFLVKACTEIAGLAAATLI